MPEFVETFNEKFVTLTSDELCVFVDYKPVHRAARRGALRCLVTATLDAEILIVPRKHDVAF